MSKQTVYNILASAKKEPVKLELALIDDVSKMGDFLYEKKAEGSKIKEEINAAAREFNKLLQKGDAATKEYNSLINKSKGLYDTTTKALADLGLSIKDSGDLINLGIAIADLDEVRMDIQDYIELFSRK
jgi:hypothetical protein